jgi:hypothetical protein
LIIIDKDLFFQEWSIGRVLLYVNEKLVIPSRILCLTLLAASSASSTYGQYACGASSLPPRYALNATWYYNMLTNSEDSVLKYTIRTEAGHMFQL